MRRSGSAAPQRSWSPQVKAETYCGPIFILRTRPMGTVRVPETAAGVSWLTESALVLGISLTHWLSLAMRRSISAMGHHDDSAPV